MSGSTHSAVKEVRGYIRELSADERARQLAEARAKALRDEASLLEDAEKRGLEKGRAEGEARGLVKGEAQALLKQIKLKFGGHPEWVEQKLNTADKDQLDLWVAKILTANSLDELFAD